MRWLGTTWRIHPLFVIIIVLSAPAGLLMESLLLFSLLFGHELAHVMMARCYGLDIEEIEIWPFGGLARIPGLVLADAAVEGMVALAGPLHNLLLLAIGIAAKPVVGPSYWLDLYIWGNLSLALLNLLPAWPLDGGRAIHGMLRRRWGTAGSVALLSRLGRWLACLIAGGAAVLSFVGYVLPNLFLLAFFLWLSAGRQTGVHLPALAGVWRRKEQLAKQNVLPIRWLMVSSDVPAGHLLSYLQSDQFHIIRISDADMHCLGEVTEDELFAALNDGGWHLPLSELIDRTS